MLTLIIHLKERVKVMPNVVDEIQEAVDYLRYSLAKPEEEPKSPNEADELTYERFVETSSSLIGPFSKVIEEHYA